MYARPGEIAGHRIQVFCVVSTASSSYVVHDERMVRGFTGKYRFLSNFFLLPVFHIDHEFSCNECAFQAAKTLEPVERKQFHGLAPKDARAFGQTVQLRDRWDFIKGGIMMQLVVEKYTANPLAADWLLDTGARHLEETNHWGDRFFGVDGMSGKGKNILGYSTMVMRGFLGGTGVVPNPRRLGL